MKLWFYCERPAERGGATPIADGREVLRRLGAGLKERFRREKVMYVRNYGDGMGLSWQTAFQTTRPAEVEAYCRKASVDFEWKGDGRLRTRQVFDTIVAHPRTGEEVWFEHAAFFHVTSLPPAVRDALLKEFREEDLPSNTYYGDGTPIEDSVLEEIRGAYEQSAARFDWQRDDVLLIDNMLTSHARDPFAGERKIAVAMSELYPAAEEEEAAWA
jgi:alpha-ketoglutarate-dependent taurine dioxygenase